MLNIKMKGKSVNILFLGGAKRVSLAERFFKSAKTMDLNLSIFSYELSKSVPISSLGKIIIGLKWDDKNILKHLLQIINKFNINIVLPFVDKATIVASKLKKICKNTFIPVSDESVCNRFYDKTKAYNWFIKNKFPVPDNSNKLPLIAKPREGSASKGIIILKTEKEFKFFLNNFNKENYLVQKYIDGIEFSVDCYISTNGEILTVVPRERVEVTNGEATKSITLRDCKIIELANRVLTKSKLIGPLTIQFLKEKKTGKIFFIEINPRFGGGVIASIEAGADIPSMLLKDYFGIPNKPVRNWKENILMVRAYREFFLKCE